MASLFFGLVMLFAVLVVGSALAYIATGFTSFGYYGGGIGAVMAFAYNTALVSGAALTALGVMLAVLYQTKRFRKYVRAFLTHFIPNT